MQFRELCAAGVSAAVLAIAGSAAATTVVLPDPGPGNYNFNPPTTIDGVTFSANSPSISGVGTTIEASQVNFFDNRFGGYIDMKFAPSTSFSAQLAQTYDPNQGPGPNLNVTVYNSGSVVLTEAVAAGYQTAFSPFSVSGVGAFDEILIQTDNNQFPGIADIQYGTFGAVPEPATWAMLILGVGMVGFAVRRRREGLAVAA